jgi:cytoskeletal protein CcmA (bactofilin family)
MTVHGDIETAGVVKVEGIVNGHVTAGQQVLVAKGGQIDGDVDTGEAVVGGSVHGSVHAGVRVEIQAGAVVQGDVTTKRILVAEGAVLNGAIRMGDLEDSARAAPLRPVVQPTLPRQSTPIARPAIPPRASSGQ